MTELERQEGGQTNMSHKTQHANPTVNSDPAGNRPLGVYQSISLTHTLQYTQELKHVQNNILLQRSSKP